MATVASMGKGQHLHFGKQWGGMVGMLKVLAHLPNSEDKSVHMGILKHLCPIIVSLCSPPQHHGWPKLMALLQN